MGMNIKDGDAHRWARELAAATGQSVTGAVREALRLRLAELRRDGSGPMAKDLLALGRDCAARLREPYRHLDHGEWLYDERGLPK